MDFRSAEAERHYEDVVAHASGLVVGMDFDGTLAPIVEDPAAATILPGTGDLLVDLAESVSALAVITGRPARQVLALGGLEEVGVAVGQHGRVLHVLGQYGNERWSSVDRRILSPQPPRGLSTFESRLPGLLRRYDAEGAYVEDKGLAVGIHTRRLDDPRGAFDRLLDPVRGLAEELGLQVEPGRLVIEVRAPGTDKGAAVRRLVEQVGAQAFCFVGDDLGDVAAFRAVRDLREQGAVAGLLVCAGSPEERALVDLADVVVDGPDGVQEFLRRLAADTGVRAG
ncbi:trehalose 6-phosphate phosphatase [Marmoricola endophyticus]|uniref:Trehalose 6-phosphate phosphatase n=1 Tax=Marmoricola endophyticus TaxID=2040280 RepID=A0A917F6U4_9ACTN|nr:trehalose-phosphatase [Marmoricola endophyticus]GGF53293.1 trehalose 6-phosphate phosphatase [Marmoricola endophyticus]